jgi:hypothetical protein
MEIINLSINVKDIDKAKLIEGKKGTYLSLTVIVRDETDKYDRDVAVMHSQSKEERADKVPPIWLGSGKVVYRGEDKARKADKATPAPAPKEDDDDLPF